MSTIFSQTDSQQNEHIKIENLLYELIEKNRGMDNISLTNSEKLFEYDLNKVFFKIKECYQEEDENVKAALQILTISIGSETNDLKLKKETTNLLLKSISTADIGLFQRGLKALQNYNEEDFDKQAKTQLSEYIEKYRAKPYNRIISLIGVANLKSETDYLKSIVNQCKQEASVVELSDLKLSKGSVCWSAIAALARMGDKHSIEYILHWIKFFEYDLIATKAQFKALAYIRQPEIVDYFKTQILSEEFSITHNTKSYIAFAAMNLIDDMLEDFPITPKKRVYSIEDLPLVREWIKDKTLEDYKIIK